MSDSMVLRNIAKSVIETLIEYKACSTRDTIEDEIRLAVDEIMGDEFNHALIALWMAAKIMGIKIVTDDISPDPNKIEVQ